MIKKKIPLVFIDHKQFYSKTNKSNSALKQISDNIFWKRKNANFIKNTLHYSHVQYEKVLG